MSSKSFIILIIPSLIYLTGCGPCQGYGKLYCTRPTSIATTLIGFDSTQIDTIYIVEFVQGSNFTKVVDTEEIFNSDNYLISNDTGYIIAEGPYGPLTSNYDAEIIIPRVKTVKIANITLYSQWFCDVYPIDTYPFPPTCQVNNYQQNGVTMSAVPIIITN